MSHANNHMLDEMENAALEQAVQDLVAKTAPRATQEQLVAMVVDHDYASLAEVTHGDMFMAIRVARIVGLHIKPGDIDDFLSSVESYVNIREATS